jgi:SAM-dependent methyltransferase
MTDVLAPEAVAHEMPRVSPTWLGLREAADATARATDLVATVCRRLSGAARLTIHDLGCGTGSMGRWLAPQLSGPQHWIMCDSDPELLEWVVADMVNKAEDGSPVTVETRLCDISELTAADLDGADLVTASALLDLLTAAEVDRVAAACVAAGSAALWTTNVVGRVELWPADPLDAQIAAAFNDHQRRMVGDRRLLGPDAVDVAAEAFVRRGAATVVRHSPWRLGADHVELLSEWFAGWLGAACEQRPELTRPTEAYARRRLAQAAAGRLEVVVPHEDLFAHYEFRPE